MIRGVAALLSAAGAGLIALVRMLARGVAGITRSARTKITHHLPIALRRARTVLGHACRGLIAGARRLADGARGTSARIRRSGPASGTATARPGPAPSLLAAARERMLSQNLRLAISSAVSLALGVLAVLILMPEAVDRDGRLARAVLLLIVVIAMNTLCQAGLTHLALSSQPRARQVAAARLTRVRRTVPLYRMLLGRSGALGEALQLVVTAGLAITLLVQRPDGVPVLALLVITVAAIATAWIGSAMGFAVECLAEDARGDAFDLPGTPGPERDFADYLSAAVVVQASAGASPLAPVTRGARRLVRDQIVLAHVTATILITLGVSVVLTAVG